MTQPNLWNRLQADARRSPKKAALLAILGLAALYFWSPLLTGMLKGSAKSSAKSPTPASPTQPAASPIAEKKNDPAQEPIRASWQSIRTLMEARRGPPEEIAWLARDPFVLELVGQSLPPPALDVVADEEPPTDDDDSEADEAALRKFVDGGKLEFAGAVLGRQASRALINGRAYAVGDALRVDDRWTLEVAAISADAVVLDCPELGPDKPIELKLKKPTLSGMQIIPAAP